MKSAQSSNTTALAQGIAMSAIIGLQYIFLPGSLESFGGRIPLFLFVRFLVACLPFLFCLKGFDWRVFTDRQVLFVCLVHPIANVLVQTYAVVYSPVTVIACLTALAPFSMFLAGWMFAGERARIPFFLFMVAAVAGAVIASIKSFSWDAKSALGVVLILASLALRSVYALSVKNSVCYYDAKEIAAAQVISATLVFGAMSAFASQWGALPEILSGLGAKGYASLAYLSLLSFSLSYVLNNAILDSLSVMFSGLLNNLTFLATFISGTVFLGEKTGWQGIVGSVVLLAAVVGASLTQAPSAAGSK